MRKKRVDIIVIEAMFVIILMSALWGQLFSLNKSSININGNSECAVSIKEDKIEQDIVVEGLLRKMRIYIGVPNCGNYGQATLNVCITQDEKSIYKVFILSELVNGYVTVSECSGVWKKGEAKLSIWCENVPNEADVFCYLSDDIGLGFDSANSGTVKLGGPIALDYSEFRFDRYFFYYLVLVIMLVLFCVLCIEYYFRIEKEKRQSKYMFMFSTILIFLFVSINNPTVSFLGEPRSEMAYEFWYKAHNLSFGENLMSLMSGESLTWTERLFMWIADRISPTKYVFSVAQIIELLFISMSSSLFTLKTFRKFFSDEFRAIVSFILGTSVLFASAYYFWSVSYWAMLFLIAFSFVDMDKLSKWQYSLAILFTIVLCVSRIYHAVFIVVGLFVLLFLREEGPRFKLYFSTIVVSSLFEVVYSFLAGAGSHLSGDNKIQVSRVIINTLYYQIQVIWSLLFGHNGRNALLANVIILICLICVIVLFVKSLLSKKKKIAILIGSMGMISMGTIMINVVTCAKTVSVSFPHNYYDKVSWLNQYYQQADLHFSYSYFSIITILLCLLYMFKSKIFNNADYCENHNGVSVWISLVLLAYCLTNFLQEGDSLKYIETDWKSIYWITKNDSYYAPINVSYGVSLISLEHNSHGAIYARREDGTEYRWNVGDDEYSHTYTYESANIGETCHTTNDGLLSVTVRRKDINTELPYYIVCYDSSGKQVYKNKQTNSSKRIMTDFYFEEPLYDIATVRFEYADGRSAYICDAIQLGILD